MGNYAKGRRREDYVATLYRLNNWFVIRCYHSAGGEPQVKVKPIDLIAFWRINEKSMFLIKNVTSGGTLPIYENPIRFIQVSKNFSDISVEEVTELERIAYGIGAQPTLTFLLNKAYVNIRSIGFWKDANPKTHARRSVKELKETLPTYKMEI